MKFISMITLLVLLATTSCSTNTESTIESVKKPTTIIIVRHAEKILNAGDNPNLTELGLERAERLAFMLEKVKVSAIYSTPYTRNKETVAQVANGKKLEVVEYEAKAGADLLEGILSNHFGETVLVCGHSNTTPTMVNLLTGSDFGSLDESDYSNMYIITVSELGKGELFHLRY